MKAAKKLGVALVVLVAAIAVALITTWMCASDDDRQEMLETLMTNTDSQEESRIIDWDSLPESVVAWVEVPGTNIDSPVAQATPDAPNAYLYEDALGSGAYGTPYIDCECSLDTPFVMIYGHHMSDGSAFADFAQFIDEDFAREHSLIVIYERNGTVHELEVVAVDVVNASRESLKIPEKGEFAARIAACDLILQEANDAEQLWAFATCSYQARNSRTIVYGVDGGAL